MKLIFAISVVLTSACQVRGRADDVSFVRDIAPILIQRCTGCHGGKRTEGEYRLHTFEFLTRAGASDEPPIVAGEPAASELFLRISSADDDLRMPQLDDALAADDVKLIRDWIAAGAKFDGADAKAELPTLLPPREHPDPPKLYRFALPIQAVAFSPDGKELAVSGYHEVTVWNSETGQLLRRLKRLPERVQAIEWSKDGSQLLIGGGSPGDYGEVSLIDAKTGRRRRVFGTFQDMVLGTAFSPDQSFVAAGSADRFVAAWETESGKRRWQNRIHSDWVTGVSIGHKGRFVASSSRDLTVKIHDAKTGALFTTYNGHQRNYGQHTGRFRIYDVVFSPDSPLAFSAGEGSAIRVWEAEKTRAENGTAGDMEARFAKKGHTRYIEYSESKAVFALAIGGSSIFATHTDGRVSQHEILSGKLIRDLKGHTDWVFAVDSHAATKRLASGAFNGEVRIWNTRNGELTVSFNAAPGWNP